MTTFHDIILNLAIVRVSWTVLCATLKRDILIIITMITSVW